MRVVAFLGDSLRHQSIALRIQETGFLAGVVYERREAFIPEPPDGLDPHLRRLFMRHFAGRSDAEERFFGAAKTTEVACPTLTIERKELNQDSTLDFVQKQRPDLVISYGVHKLSDKTLAALPNESWNSHGGLSPWYRGVTTHFWPSYMLEPQMTGMTLHRLTSKLDAGSVVHQTVAPLVEGDGVHDLACRTVQAFGDELQKVLTLFEAKKLLDLKPQRSSGKLWLARDWRPEHLRLIYDIYEDRIVDRYLQEELTQHDPELVRQF